MRKVKPERFVSVHCYSEICGDSGRVSIFENAFLGHNALRDNICSATNALGGYYFPFWNH